MEKAKSGDTVTVKYVGKMDDGKVVASSEDRGPLEFTLGQGEVLPGLDQAVMGMSQGESKEVTITADQAFGQREEDKVITVDRERFSPEVELSAGQRMVLTDSEGREVPVKITEVTDNNVTLDGNHPLAGQDLSFEIELLKVAGAS